MTKQDLGASMDGEALDLFTQKGNHGEGMEGAGDLAALKRMQRKEKELAKDNDNVTDSAQKPLLI